MLVSAQSAPPGWKIKNTTLEVESDGEAVDSPPLQKRSSTDPGPAKHDDELHKQDAHLEGADQPLAEAAAEHAGDRKTQLHQVHDRNVDAGLATNEWDTDDELERPMPQRPVANGPPPEADEALSLMDRFGLLLSQQGWHLLRPNLLSEEWIEIGLRTDVIEPMEMGGVSHYKLEPIAAWQKWENLDLFDPDKVVLGPVLGEVLSLSEELGLHIISSSHLGKATNLQRLGRLQAGSSDKARRKARKQLFVDLDNLGVHTEMVNKEKFYCNRNP